MRRVATRLAIFAALLAASFSAAYLIGDATDDGHPPTHQEHEP